MFLLGHFSSLWRSLWMASSCSGVSPAFCKLTEGTFCSIIPTINEDITQDWTHCWSLGYTISSGVLVLVFYWTLCYVDHHLPGPVIQWVFTLSHYFLIQPMHHQLALRETSVKGLTEVKAENIQCFPLIYQTSHLITNIYQVGQAWLPIGEAMITTDDFPVLKVPGNGFQA